MKGSTIPRLDPKKPTIKSARYDPAASLVAMISLLPQTVRDVTLGLSEITLCKETKDRRVT